MERAISYRTTHKNWPGITLGVLAAIVLAIAVGYGVYVWQQRKIEAKNAAISSLSMQLKQAQAGKAAPVPTTMAEYSSTKGVRIIVYRPLKNVKVSSPVAVIGEVPGNWSFEASFPLELQDSSGRTIAQSPAHVLGAWMTSQLVPFSASLTYTGTPSGTGALVLHKDNPSGQSQNDDQLSIPVQF